MKVQLRINLENERDGVRGQATREGEMAFAPPVDIEYECPPWLDAKKPECVSYSIDTAKFHVYFGLERFQTTDEIRSRIAEYISCGWKVSGLERYTDK